MADEGPIITRKPSIFNDTTHQQNQLKRPSDDSLTLLIDYSLLVTNPLNNSVVRKMQEPST
jgi:hypothetical protein